VLTRLTVDSGDIERPSEWYQLTEVVLENVVVSFIFFKYSILKIKKK